MLLLSRIQKFGSALQPCHFRRNFEGVSAVLCSNHGNSQNFTLQSSTLIGNLHHLHTSQVLGVSPKINNIGSSTFIRSYSSVAGDDERGSLVYRGRVGSMLKTLKVFSVTTSGISLAVQPYFWLTYQDMALATALPIFIAINTLVVLNPILIHILAKKYVTELYFNPVSKVFTASTLSFFARKEYMTFTAADVEVPDVPNVFAMLKAKGRPLFVHEQDFTSLEVYKHLMGFDRPLDLTYLSKEDKGNNS